MKPYPSTRLGVLRVLLLFALPATVAWWFMVRMPGKSFRGAPPSLTSAELALRDELRDDVQKIAGEIGERNLETYLRLQAAADFIEHSLGDAGLHPVRQGYQLQGRLCENIEVEIIGAKPEIVVIGAHYDTVPGCPGANDNGSGVAALLALARRAPRDPARTLRFVAFVNEEPGYFQTDSMGSAVYAKACQVRGDRIVAMISLETIGYYSNTPGSQHYPAPGLGAIYPTVGNFISFVGNVSSRALVRQAIGIFREHATIPSEGAALPSIVPGVAWSDQWSFWRHGYPGIMITDTAPFRYPHYHEPTDTPEKLDYDSMTRVVSGMEKVISSLTSAE
ncbi:MAG: M28 family peptidase [Chthoniobacterales bacterium]